MGTDVTVHTNNAIAYSLGDMQQLAKAVAASGLFGMKTTEQAMALMAIAQAEGRPAASAAMDYHIVNNRPTLKADTMLARFQSSGGSVEWHKYTDEVAEATFTHPKGGSVRLSWDMARAEKAGVMGNPTWKKYPRAMLRARTISEGIRTVYPGILNGMYTPEEIEDTQPVQVVKGRPRKIPEETEFAEVKPSPAIAAPDGKPHRINIGVLDNGHSDWMQWVKDFGAAIRSAKNGEEFEQWLAENQEPLGGLRKICEETGNKLYSQVMARIDQLAPKNQTIEQEAAE